MKYLGILLLSILSLSSPVSANCAWVLWSTLVGGKDGLMHVPVAGFDNQKSCETQMKQHKDEATRTSKVAVYRCLPDTVNPQGK